MRPDSRELVANREFNETLHTVSSPDAKGRSFVCLDGSYFEKLRSVRHGWPTCDGDTEPCGKRAVIVCASSRWQEDGFHDTEDRTAHEAHFCCLDHVAKTDWWYWFWLVPADERNDDCPTIQEWNFLIHLTEKTWGLPFLGWLLTNYEMRSMAL